MSKQKSWLTILACGWLICICQTCSWQTCVASTGELYGMGSKAASLANTMFAGTSGGFATFYNPAANSKLIGVNLSLGLGFAHPNFTDVQNVTVANNATTAEGSDVTGNMDMSYLDHLGQTLGISINLGEKLRYLTIGLAGVMPVARTAYLDTGEPFQVEYFNYRSRTQRLQLYGSLGGLILGSVYAAGGLAFGTNLSATTSVFLTAAKNSVSYQRFASSIKPSASPYFSVYLDKTPLEAGLTIRLPNKYKVSIDTNATARVMGNTSELLLASSSFSTLYYDPLEIDLGLSYRLKNLWSTLELDWFQYSQFESPTLTITDRGSAITLKNSISSAPPMRDIFVPKIGFEYAFYKVLARLGYFYRPSPVKDNLGPGNLVDPAKHVVTTGIGIDLAQFHLTTKSLLLDLHGQYHFLVKTHVVKTAGNEVGVSGQTKVGSPGYDIGGSIYALGLSASMVF